MPKRRGSEEDGVGGQPELFEQGIFGGVALAEDGIVENSEQALVDVVHLRVAGEEDEGPPAGDFEDLANAVGGTGAELGGAGVGQIRRDVQQRLRFIIKMRRQHRIAGVLNAKPALDVFEAAADSQCGGGEDDRVHAGEEGFAQDGRHVDRSRLQIDIVTAPASSPALDPEDRVGVFRFHEEAQLHPQLFRSSHEGERLLGFLRHSGDFRRKPAECLHESQEFFAIFFQKFASRVEGKPIVSRRKQGEEKLRAVA